jgi:signal transduction histidine kinase/CheY-like chemotaxis protein/HPt (histidine-containing phosphotransfer) domain-containing protein
MTRGTYATESHRSLAQAALAIGREQTVAAICAEVTEQARGILRAGTAAVTMDSAITPAADEEALDAPLVDRNGGPLGTLRVGRPLAGGFTADDESVLRQLAQLGALAIENARMYEAEQRARDRAVRLQELTTALTESSTVADVVEAVVRHTTSAFDAAGTVITRISDDGSMLLILDALDMPDSVEAEWQVFPLASPVPLAEVARTGIAQYLESRNAWLACYPQLLPLLDQTGHQANAVMPLTTEGHVIGALGVAFDRPRQFPAEDREFAESIANAAALALERARLFEAERQARSDAESANRAKSQFLAVMSHELRTPLNAMLGMSELLRDTPLSSDQEQFARSIHDNAEALLAIVGDLLDSSRIESGQLDLESIPFSPRDVIEGVAESLAARADDRGLDLVLGVAPDLPALVLGDPNRLRQVLLNVVSNAIKFTLAGEVVIHATARAVPGAIDLHISVADTGIGIAAEDQQRIFRAFEQADRSTARRFGGTGLGLNIVHSLLRLMGGSIRVESAPGRGSTFELSVPLVVEAPAPPRQPASLSDVNILALVPGRVRRDNIAELLAAHGATITAVTTSQEALAAAAADHYAVTVIDDRVPGLARLLGSLRRIGRERSRVILLCSLRAVHMRSAVIADEVFRCVYKPIRHERLLTAVGEAVDRPLHDMVAGTARPGAPPAYARPHILIADDSSDIAGMLSRSLRAAGCQVRTVANGRDAVVAAARFRFDAVLMDIHMPVMDGLQAAAAIRVQEAAAGETPVPIIAMSTSIGEDVRGRALHAGMDDYVAKPFDPAELTELVGHWTDARAVVVVADDSADNQLLVRNFLAGEPYRLVFADTGRAAVEECRRQRVSALLLDMDMPEMDGYTAAAELRRDPRLRELPIIAMTGHVGMAERQKCLNAGCSGYIAKPMRRAELIDKLQQVLPAAAAAASRSERAGDATGSKHILVNAQQVRERIVRLLQRPDFKGARTLARELRSELNTAGHRGVAVAAQALEAALAAQDIQSSIYNAELLGQSIGDALRLAAVRQMQLLDSPADDEFDRLTRLVTERLAVPVALVTLLDEERQFFMSLIGLNEPWASSRETPLTHSFCQHVVAAAEPLIIDDARRDPVVCDSLAIRDLGVIAYAGVPLFTTDGFAVGSLCAIDTQPRSWTAADLNSLHEIAALVEAQMSRRAHQDGAAFPESLAGDDETARMFAERFLLHCREDVERIDGLISAGSMTEVARAGHQIKGSAPMFGFEEIGSAGAALERAARSGDAGATAAELQRLKDALARP